jgi:hypothetical protein
MTLAELYERVGGVREPAFYEQEIHRVTQRFGNIAHVWSTYVTSNTPSGARVNRGISSIQLYFDGSRWWITGWADEGERPGSPIPPAFLPIPAESESGGLTSVAADVGSMGWR